MKLVRRRHHKRGHRRKPLILRPNHSAMIEGRSIHRDLVQSVQPEVEVAPHRVQIDSEGRHEVF
jgi:hypothetical protein